MRKIIILMMIFVGAQFIAPDVGLPIQKRAQQAAPLQAVFAADTTWGFDSASQYTYDTSVIEVTGGVAKLKNLGGALKDDAILEYNSAFVAGDTTRGYSGTASGPDVSLVLETVSATFYKASGTFTSRVFDTASGCGGWQRLNATVANGDIPNADSLFDSGLVSVWHMNNDWNDSKGTWHGVANGATFSSSAKLGSACGSFNGLNNNVGISAAFPLTADAPITVEAWIKASAIGANQIIVGKYNDSASWDGFILWLIGSDVTFYLMKTYGGYNLAMSSSAAIQPSNWYHVVASYDGSVGKIYLNGTIDTPVNYNGGYDNHTGASLVIGSHCYDQATGPFNGLIDEVAIWNRALDSSEIADHYNAGDGKELHRAVKLQVRSGSTVEGVGSALWVGPLGDSTSYYTGANETLVSGGGFNTTHRFAQYKAYLNGSTDSTRTPTVASVALVGSAGSVFDNTEGDFDLGTYSTTNASVVVGRSSFVGLSKMANGGYNSYGTYTSRVIDGGVGPNWSTLNFTTGGTEIDASENGLVGLWHMNGNWLDAKGTNNGTRYGTGTAFSTLAKLGSHAGSFNGTSDYVDCGSMNFGGEGISFTVESWVKRVASGTNDIVLQQQGWASPNSMLIFYFKSNDQFSLAFYGNDLTTSGTYPDVEWHHWVGTYNGTTNARVIYRDRIVVASDTALSDYVGYGNLYIGEWYPGPPDFSGLIDEVAIYNRALSAAEVMDHYQNANPGTVKFQCRADTTTAGLATKDFTGPDSTTATFYESTGSDLGYQFDAKQYLQYRMYLE